VNPWAGRDHGPRCSAPLLAGGGVWDGLVCGKSGRVDVDPAKNPVNTFTDLSAACRGVVTNRETNSGTSRKRPVTTLGLKGR
jgi:hypothetical protein